MTVVNGMLRFPSVAALIDKLQPEEPIHCLRPPRLQAQAQRFLHGFPGDLLYAVKCNAHPAVLSGLSAAGCRHYDVASDAEIMAVRTYCPGATLYYHHPAKSVASIERAYHRHNVRYFAVDSHEELAKVLALTGPDAVITIRLAVPQEKSVYDLSTKFGASPELGRELVAATMAAKRKVGLTFHVGSQCLDPAAFTTAIQRANDIAAAENCQPVLLDVGGGFPGHYATTVAPPLEEYFQTIAAAKQAAPALSQARLGCEPGRALVYTASSLLTQVVLRKGNVLYLNDGIFGGLAEIYWGGAALTLHQSVHMAGHKPKKQQQAFTLYGPTCDGNDKLPYSVTLPSNIREGDWIEFHDLGAYGREMSTRYNGLQSDTVFVIQED